MGLLAQTLGSVGSLLPSFGQKTVTVGNQIPTWQNDHPQSPRYWHNFLQYARDGYAGNELVYTAVEELATSAAEPRLVAVRKRAGGKTEQLKEHPVLDLFERPNPFMSRYQLIAMLIMYRAVAGNAYLNLGRSASGKVVELWTLRPDRMFVVPDDRDFIKEWEYRLETQTFRVGRENIIQTKTRNPLDEWYGLPPLAACAPRVDTDTFMRSFTLSFFRNAGVPAGLLTVTQQMSEARRQVIRDRFRSETGGPQNWHQMLVLDNTEATYTPMGMPLGQSGIVLPELDEINEARIGMVFGIPLELIGARLGMIHGNRSTMDAARAHFWQETLSPLYQEIAADLTRGLYAEYEGTGQEFDYLEFDLSTVKALQEDEDKKHLRIRSDVAAGIISVQEARVSLGKEPDFEPDALLMLARGLEPMSAEAALEGAPPEEQTAGGVQPMEPGQKPNGQNGNGNGHSLTPADVAALKELAGRQ